MKTFKTYLSEASTEFQAGRDMKDGVENDVKDLSKLKVGNTIEFYDNSISARISGKIVKIFDFRKISDISKMPSDKALISLDSKTAPVTLAGDNDFNEADFKFMKEKAPIAMIVDAKKDSKVKQIWFHPFNSWLVKDKTKVVLLKEEKVKAYKLTIPKKARKLDGLSTSQKEDYIFGEEGDDSFVQNQDIVTIETIKIQGDTLLVFPYNSDDKNYNSTQIKLQKAFDQWINDEPFGKTAPNKPNLSPTQLRNKLRSVYK